MIAKRVALLVLVMVLAICVAGCPKSLKEEDLTPLEKAKLTATWINDTYTAQYDDYQSMVVRSDLTEAQKQILRAKYDIFQEVDPLRKRFNELIDQGLVPDRELEAQIVGLINDLQQMVLTGGG